MKVDADNPAASQRLGTKPTPALEAAHTPTPWRTGGPFSEFIVSTVGNESSVARATGVTRDEAEANAAFIVRACNSFDALVAALKEVPDPEEQGFCDPCGGGQLELKKEIITTKDGASCPRWYFQHLEHCWFGKVVAALALATKTDTEDKDHE